MSFGVHCFACSDVKAFLEIAGSFLFADEAEHCQILGFVTGAQLPNPPANNLAAVFAVALDGEKVVAVTAWTPARVALSAGPEGAIRLLVAGLVKHGIEAMSVLKGPVEAVNWFADEVGHTLGMKNQVKEEALLYRLDALNDDVKMPPGGFRQASVEDLDRFYSIMQEEHGELDREQIKTILTDPETCNKWHFWCDDDGLIVAQAKFIQWTSGCAGVQGVYTPFDSRGKGYATGVMHGMCKTLLEKYKVLVLYVAKDNVPANRVYQKIGFTQVLESKMVRFIAA